MRQLRLGLVALVLLALLATGAAACGSSPASKPATPAAPSTPSSPPATSPSTPSTPPQAPPATEQPKLPTVTGTLKVHFIDVGQGDSILIQTPGLGNVLVDAGDSAHGSTVVSYLKGQGVSELAWLIATHPHEDHIGGMVKVLDSFPVKNLSMPRASHTTRTYENLLLAIKNKGLTVFEARAGRSILEAANLRTCFMSPTTTSYDDLNDWSAVLKIQYGTTSFMLAGDAGAKPEGEMLLSSARQPTADVLKVGHHGSSHTTSLGFLKAVAPKYAVISVGAGNSYGYPVEALLDRLVAQKVTVYRTDLHGSVIVLSDGQTLTVKTQKPGQTASAVLPLAATTPPSSPTVYITKTGSKYHADGCRSLSQSKIPISLEEAKAKGYGPCSICKPPQ